MSLICRATVIKWDAAGLKNLQKRSKSRTAFVLLQWMKQTQAGKGKITGMGQWGGATEGTPELFAPIVTISISSRYRCSLMISHSQ